MWFFTFLLLQIELKENSHDIRSVLQAYLHEVDLCREETGFEMEAQLLAANYHKNLYRRSLWMSNAPFTRILWVFHDEGATEYLGKLHHRARNSYFRYQLLWYSSLSLDYQAESFWSNFLLMVKVCFLSFKKRRRETTWVLLILSLLRVSTHIPRFLQAYVLERKFPGVWSGERINRKCLLLSGIIKVLSLPWKVLWVARKMFCDKLLDSHNKFRLCCMAHEKRTKTCCA